MSDVKGTVLDAIMDAVTGRAGAATSFVALVVASFFLGARLLATAGTGRRLATGIPAIVERGWDGRIG